MENLLENAEVLYHSSIRLGGEQIIYFDPFEINGEPQDADYIFITHDHYDHFSEKDIGRVKKDGTKIVVPESLAGKAEKMGFSKEDICCVSPEGTYRLDGLSFQTIPAYNKLAPFHTKRKGWVGYILEIAGTRCYIAGDTDITKENKKVSCDVAFIPIGGTYTMDAKQAAELVNIIKPKVAVPTHYGCIVGKKEDADVFSGLLSEGIECKILLKL